MKSRLVLIAACLSVFFEALDVSIVALALPSIRSSFNAEEHWFEWLQTGYVLAYGGFLLLGGRASDIYGRKKIYLIGSLVFLLSSLGAGLCTDLFMLIGMRCLQGVGAAFAIPAAISIITHTYTDPHQRNKALGAFGSFAALGFASGLMAGGLIVNYYHWHWIFWLNVPIIAVVLIIAWFLFPKDEEMIRKERDWLGGTLLVMAIILASYSIHAVTTSANKIVVAVCAIIATLLIYFFIAWERRRTDPLIDLRIFKNAYIIKSNVAGLLLGGSFLSFVTLLSIYMQRSLSFDAFRSGIILFPFSIASALVAAFVLPLMQRKWSVVTTAIIGYIFLLAGCLSFSAAILFKLNLFLYVSIFFVNAVAISIIYPSITSYGIQHAKAGEHGLVAGLQSTSYSIGCGAGIALLWSVIRALNEVLSGPRNELIIGMIVISMFSLLAIAILNKNSEKTHPRTSRQKQLEQREHR